MTKSFPFLNPISNGADPDIQSLYRSLENILENGMSGLGTVTSVGMSAPSVFTVGGSPVTGAGTLALTFAPGLTQNQVLATPNAAPGPLGLRSLVGGDLPATGIAAGTYGGAGSTVGITVDVTGRVDAISVFALTLGPSGVTSGTYGAPNSVAAFQVNSSGQLTSAASELISLSGAQITSGTVPGSQLAPVNLTINGTNGGVTGVLPVTNGGTGANSVAANTLFVGPTSGASGAPGFRAMVANDLPNSGAAAGTYGDSQHALIAAISAKGVITSVTSVAITSTGGGGGTTTNPITPQAVPFTASVTNVSQILQLSGIGALTFPAASAFSNGTGFYTDVSSGLTTFARTGSDLLDGSSQGVGFPGELRWWLSNNVNAWTSFIEQAAALISHNTTTTGTIPRGYSALIAEPIGGGASGGAGTNVTNNGGGGGGGASPGLTRILLTGLAGTPYTASVGAGGLAAGGGANGANGGNSILQLANGLVLTGFGGGGGIPMTGGGGGGGGGGALGAGALTTAGGPSFTPLVGTTQGGLGGGGGGSTANQAGGSATDGGGGGGAAAAGNPGGAGGNSIRGGGGGSGGNGTSATTVAGGISTTAGNGGVNATNASIAGAGTAPGGGGGGGSGNGAFVSSGAGASGTVRLEFFP